MTGPACTRSVISPRVTVVAPLKPERSRPTKFNIRGESFIWLKADICNKSAALLGSTSTLCISKSLMQRVSTKCIIMTLLGFTGGKDMRSSIGLGSSRLPLVWTAFT